MCINTMSWSVAPLTLGHHDVIMITSSLQHCLLTVGGEFEGDRCFCLCEGTASAPALRGIYDRQRWVSSFPLLERSEGEQHGRWEGRQHGLGGRKERREFDNAVPNKP